MRKILSIILAILCFSLPLVGCGKKDGVLVAKGDVKNIVIMIGDGMGFNHIENAKRYFGLGKQPFEANCLQSQTYSKSHAVTDSAAGATAIACGQKANNGEIGKVDGVDVQNIMELAKLKGKKTGVLTTDKLTGATPASFTSHALNRKNMHEIIKSQLNSETDLMMGRKGSGDLYSTTYKAQFEAEGYLVLENINALPSSNEKRLLGGFEGFKDVPNQTNLKNMVAYSMNYLKNESGYVLMVESAYIDKFSHEKEFYNAMYEVREFFNAINFVYNYCQKNSDTILIVTADHETGGLALGQETLDDSLYSSDGHTGVNVPLYYYGFDFKQRLTIVENTYIFDICKYFI